MWWKRILYYLIVVILGIGITTLSGSIAFNTLSTNLIKKASKENNYTTVENYFTYITVTDIDKFYSGDVNDVHVETFPCIVTQPYYKKGLDGGISVKYDIQEEAICFSFFHLPKTFQYSDKTAKSRLNLQLSNGNAIDLLFDNLKENEDAINYHINFVSYVEMYYSLNIYITYDDFISHGGSLEASINRIELFDGNNSSSLSLTFNNRINFMSNFHNDFHEVCQKYRDYILLYGEAHSVTTYERKYALKDKIDQVAINNPNKYLTQPKTTTVLATTPFILVISLTASIYISLAIVASWNIFHKKRGY